MAATIERLSQALTERYRVERELDRGGMATVFLAADLKHHRQVAIKVLDPEVAAAIGPERFLREIETVARLAHPHILPLHDSGVADGLFFYVMPFVEGESLRARLTREKQLPLEDALRITREVADALGCAHGHGVVHRDVKPENILLEEGHAVVTDFGIARANVKGAERLSATGVAVGTPAYMSPEQAAGSPDVDGRSDLYSLGCVLYEMLAGQTPFTGPTAESLVHQHLSVAPRPVTVLRPAVPAGVERVLVRALAKAPADRFATTGAFLAALDRAPARRAVGAARAAALAGVAVVAAVAALAWWQGWWVSSRTQAPETLALVEFENLTGDPAIATVVKGALFDLETSLVQFCRVNVALSTMKESDGSPVRDLERVAREYGASSVLTGSVRYGGPPGPGRTLTLHTRMVRAADHTTRQAWDFDAPSSDLLSIVRDLTTKVVAFLPRLPAANAATLEDATARRWVAQEAYLRGLGLFASSDPVLRERAGVEFDTALSLEPGFGRALAARSRVDLAAYLRDRDTTRLGPAEQDARAAAAMPASEIEGRIALGRILRERGRTAESIEELLAASRLNDSNAEPYTELGTAYAKLGDMDRARGFFHRSVEVQPTSPRAWRGYGRFLLFTVSDLPGAEQAFRRELRLTPDANRGYETVAAALTMQCRYGEALTMYAQRPHPEQRSLDLYGNRGTAYFFNGNYDLALRDFLDAAGTAPEDGGWRVNLGDVYEHLGRHEEALREYRLAVRLFGRDRAIDPEDAVARSREAKALAKAGERSRALQAADSCVAAGPWRNSQVVLDLAMVYAICGERDRAVAALDTLVRARGFAACLVRAEDEFAGLRDHPRFKQLVGL